MAASSFQELPDATCNFTSAVRLDLPAQTTTTGTLCSTMSSRGKPPASVSVWRRSPLRALLLQRWQSPSRFTKATMPSVVLLVDRVPTRPHAGQQYRQSRCRTISGRRPKVAFPVKNRESRQNHHAGGQGSRHKTHGRALYGNEDCRLRRQRQWGG